MKTYTPEKKQEAIDRFISGESAAAILADIGIPKSTFYNWVRIYQEEQAELNRKTVDIRNFHLLENKVARLETIIEILKSASCTPKSPLKQRLYAAEQLYGEYNIHVICDAFDIPRGTFYNHVLRNKRDNTWYAKRREELRLQIQEIYDESNQIFGAAKIAAVMKSNGIKVSDEMVRTLMRDMGLVSIRQSAKKLYEDECRKYKNHLNQEFDVSRPNEVWVSDVTYFKYGKSAYYICVIIDLFYFLYFYQVSHFRYHAVDGIRSFLDHRVMHFRQSQCIERSFLNCGTFDSAFYLFDFNGFHNFNYPL